MDSVRSSKRHALLALAVLAIGLDEARLPAQSRSNSREDDKTGRSGSIPPAADRVAPPVTTAPAPQPVRKDPPLKVFLSEDGETVYLVGMILDGSYHQFDEVLRKAPKAKRLHLSSSGGYTIEARLIAALTRKRKLDTYVEFYCASACTQIFASGRERVLGPHAQLGFHQAVMVNPSGKHMGVRRQTDRKLTSTLVFGINGNDTLRLAYELAGIDPAFIEKALSFKPENMWVPTFKELLDARVITRVADRTELPPPPGGGPREMIEARLLEQPLWRAAKAKMPRLADTSIDDIWRAANSGYPLDQAIIGGRNTLIDALSKELPRATDGYLDRALRLYADAGRRERGLGYPACKALADGETDSNAADADFVRNEDVLFTEFLMSEERVALMDQMEATRFFAREVLPLMTGAYRDGFKDDREGHCRLGFKTFEVIDGLPAKKRLKAYRALLSMTANLDD